MSTPLELRVDNVPIRLYAQEPPPESGKGHAAIILLHGAGGNLDFWTSRFGPYLQEAGIALYAPHYFDRTGTTRADPALLRDGPHVPQWLDVIDATVRLAASRPGIHPERIVLAGISLGAFLSLAFAATLSAADDPAQHQRLRAVVAISGGLVNPFAAQANSAFPATLILHGEQDNVVPVSYAESLDRKLTELNVAHRTEILPGEGHWFTAAALPRMLHAVSGFLQAHLDIDAVAERAM